MKKRKVFEPPMSEVELNVMPFIDIFSLLCTFLLFTAVFVSIGIVEVQVPFISNASPAKGDQEDKRQLQISVDMSKDKIELRTSFSQEPKEEVSEDFPRSEEGLSRFHRKLVNLKNRNQDSDKVSFYCDDDVILEEIVEVLDVIKLKVVGDPGYAAGEDSTLYRKVVMSSVLL